MRRFDSIPRTVARGARAAVPAGVRAAARALTLAALLGLPVPALAVAADHAFTPPPFRIDQATADSIRYAVLVANGNAVGVTLTNYGFVGNNFISRSPSLEYPLGAGYEHLVRGGLWVGGYAQDDEGNLFHGVTTAAVDGSQGSASQGATEFTPAGTKLEARSSLPNNDSYSPLAISELDVISRYSDRPGKRADNTGEDHRPLGIIVQQENYAWSFSDYQHINIFHYVITNDGPPMKDVWVGFYNEFASGAKKDYATWPPSGWYNKKWLAVDDTLSLKSVVGGGPPTVRTIPPLLREHYCTNKPVPTNCELHRAPYWIGLKLLGWRRAAADTVTLKKASLTAWGYRPGSPLRNEDIERYALMSTGTIQPLVGDSLEPSSGDPVSLLSVGPFGQLDPGDTITVDFALVGGAEIRDIQEHARFAQRAFDRNYIVPVPPPSPRLKVIARHNALDLYWDDSPESAVDPTSPLPQDFEGYRVYVGTDRLDLRRVAEFDLTSAPHDTTGFNTGFGAIRRDTVIDGRSYSYHYRVRPLRDGFKTFVAVTSFDLGNVEIESLESGVDQNKAFGIPGPGPGEVVGDDKVSVFPNPYRVEARWDQGELVRDHYLWFTNLPTRARLRIFTLAGDLVFETDFDGATYAGQGARGIYDPRRELDVSAPSLSGRTYGWNMITRQGQAAATGLYMYTVEDRDGGDIQRGRFVIVKSDREGL